MNTRQLQQQFAAHQARHAQRHLQLSRRQFVKGGLAAAAALTVGTQLWQTERVLAAPSSGVDGLRPIPYGSYFVGPPPAELFHVEAPGYPGLGEPAETSNAATLTDFNCALGLVYVGGHGGVHTDKVKNITTTGVHWEVDMRFMVGEFVGKDGRHRHGAFGLI